MGKHEYTKLDRARDEMMSHVVRCEVLDAELEHRMDWLEETMEYMLERYPMLSELELTQLEMVGRQFIKPAIPHGGEHNAVTRERNMDELMEIEVGGEPADTTEAPDVVEADVGAAGEVEEEIEKEEIEKEEIEKADLQAA